MAQRRLGPLQDLGSVLCQINPDRRNLVHGWLPPLVLLDDSISGTDGMPSGAISPITSGWPESQVRLHGDHQAVMVGH